MILLNRNPDIDQGTDTNKKSPDIKSGSFCHAERSEASACRQTGLLQQENHE